jgi:O-antigen/teichoic acid export membrane protein
MWGIGSTAAGREGSLSKKLIRSVMFGGLRSLVVLPIPFFLTPLILVKIGAAGYGTWAVFLALNGMTSLADLGLVAALSKFVAEHYATRDYVSLNRLLNTGFMLFGLLSLVIAGLLWTGTPFVTRFLFRGSPFAKHDLNILFREYLIAITANILILLFASVTTGLQRLDVTNVMSGFNTILAAILDAVLLLLGWGLRGLVYGQIVAILLTLAGYVILMKRLLPEARFSPSSASTAEAKRIFGFSVRLYFTQAAVTVHNNIEKILLGSLVGVQAVGWYDIANDLSLKIRGAISIILSPIMPAASELDALNDDRRLVELYYRSHKYLAFIGIPIACFVGAVSVPFVTLWIGTGMRVVAVPLAVLLFVHVFNLVSGPGFLIFAGLGNLTPGIRSAVVGIVLNVLLSSVLIYRLGFAGAVIGTSISVIVATVYFLYLFHAQTGHPVKRLLRESIIRPVLCSVGVLGMLRLFQPFVSSSWLGLIAQGLTFGIVYVIAMVFSRFFDRYDWGKLESILPAMRYARRFVPVA